MIPTLTLLPPDMFPPDLQPLIYFTLMPAIIICGFIGLIMFYILVVPPEAKTYIWNKISKKDMFDVETESGVRILDTGKIYPEGIAKLDKTKLTVPIPRPIPNQQIKLNMASQGMTQDKMDEVIKQVREAERSTLKPSIVKGLGCRIYRVFQSTALATSMKALVGLEYDGNSKTSVMVIPVRNNKQKINLTSLLKKGRKADEVIMDVALPVDPNVIRKWFDPQFSPSQADAIQHLGEQLERERTGSMLRKWMFPIIIIIVIVVIALAAVMLLGGGGGGGPPPQPAA